MSAFVELVNCYWNRLDDQDDQFRLGNQQIVGEIPG